MVAIRVSVGECLALSVFVRLVCSLYWALCRWSSLWTVGWTGVALLQVVRRCSSTGGVRVNSVAWWWLVFGVASVAFRRVA